MKIVLTGGGTGGHFYPIIAVAEELNDIARNEHLSDIELFYFSDDPYDEASLYEQHMNFVTIPAGKLHLGKGLANIGNMFSMLKGVLLAIPRLYKVFPDVVFGKGGYASFPTLVAARILGIPVIIHESDAHVGRANARVAKWAKRIAVSYKEAIETFPKKDQKKILYTGQPIRRKIREPQKTGAREYLQLEYDIPTILIIGGSQGAELINDALWPIIGDLLYHYQIIHQVGVKNMDVMEHIVATDLVDHEHKDRYKPYGFLNELSSSMSAGVADIVVGRAGSQIFEIASWGIPSIIIPRTHSVNDHNRKNAFIYGRTGAATVIEEKNLSPHVLHSEIERILENEDIKETMKQSAGNFVRNDSARLIAEEILELGAHEKKK